VAEHCRARNLPDEALLATALVVVALATATLGLALMGIGRLGLASIVQVRGVWTLFQGKKVFITFAHRLTLHTLSKKTCSTSPWPPWVAIWGILDSSWGKRAFPS